MKDTPRPRAIYPGLPGNDAPINAALRRLESGDETGFDAVVRLIKAEVPSTLRRVLHRTPTEFEIDDARSGAWANLCEQLCLAEPRAAFFKKVNSGSAPPSQVLRGDVMRAAIRALFPDLDSKIARIIRCAARHQIDDRWVFLYAFEVGCFPDGTPVPTGLCRALIHQAFDQIQQPPVCLNSPIDSESETTFGDLVADGERTPKTGRP
ncbi:MAG: hypothetical protein M0T79_09700 [Actinomycetota bacterium]|nr:hypothetical protein [Actinomycetota bacterium]